MNNLEFIEKEINWTISRIEFHKERLLNFKEKKEGNIFYIFEKDLLNEYEEKIKYLQQIKTELEGLKIIKNRVPKNLILNFVYLEEEKTVKKALEVNE